jgi:4-hydroxy-2,2'-bipyrrole-5-carbaldehyde O-methyltransferase
MKLRTVFSLVCSGQVTSLFWVVWAARAHYRLAFIAGGLSSGLFQKLVSGPVPMETLASDLGLKSSLHDGLRAWLEFGVGLGELRSGADGYTLRRRRTIRLLKQTNDSVAAVLQETAILAGSFVSQGLLQFTSASANNPKRFTLADQSGPLTARTSRLSEPFICEVLEAMIPKDGAFSLFEIGCGAAAYIRYAAKRNPNLTALGLELQPDVAVVAAANIAKWNLGGRVTVEEGDITRRKAEPVYDLATLHQNIYYFPVERRVELLRHVQGFLKSGGRLLLTTCCQGGGAGARLLDFWASMTEGCGRLPFAAEMAAQLEGAGFCDVAQQSLIPGESFCAFVGTKR